MLKIEITDPQFIPQDTLIKLSKFLASLAERPEMTNSQDESCVHTSTIDELPSQIHFSKEYIEEYKKMAKERGDIFPEEIDMAAHQYVGTGPIANIQLVALSKEDHKEVPPPPIISESIVTCTSSNEISLEEPEKINNLTYIVVTPKPEVTIKFKDNKKSKEKSEHDKNGIPWDERIHSKSKTKNSDGDWVLKRGVSLPLVHSVTNELKGIKVEEIKPIHIEEPDRDPALKKFDNFVRSIANHLVKQRVTRYEVNKACESVGLETMSDLKIHPDLIDTVTEKLEIIIREKYGDEENENN